MKLIPIVSALSTFSCAFVINKRAKQKVPKSGQAVKNKGTGGQAATKPVVPTAFFNRFKWSTSGSKKLTTAEIKELGISSLAKKLGISRGDLFITSSIVDSAGVSHLYYKRKSLGIEIRYQESAVHILNGQVIAMSGVANAPSLKDDMVSRALISAASASKIASATYGIKAVGSPRLLYIQAYEDNNDYEHVFEVELLDTIEGKHMMVLVNARDGTIIITNSFIKSYSYNVISLPNVSPYEGGFQDVYDPERNSSSPNGWSINDTSSGNNAHVAFYRDGSTLTSEDGRFGTTWQSDQKPSKAQNVKAAIANAFYAVNMVHDISYQYGFNEVAGNFQNKNFGRGQGGNDEVKVLIQDYRASSNAWFGVGPDGFPGILSLGLFDLGSETRDSALDNSIIIHEYSHGITARLTGGKRAYYCLSGIIPNGMDEGWADAFSFMLTTPSNSVPKSTVIAAYAVNQPSGIRIYPYSTDLKINPLKFSNSRSKAMRMDAHSIGTIWATILFEAYWGLIQQYGFSSNWMDSKQKQGNIVMMQLLIAGLQLQPCNPSFIDARDAILLADSVYYKGIHECTLWRAFAKRGLGVSAAATGGKDGFDVPAGCK